VASFLTLAKPGDGGNGMLNVQVIERLFDILGKEFQIYSDLLKMSADKTSIIVEGKVTELEEMVKSEQSLVLQIEKLEDEREELIDELAEEMKINASEITMSELMKKLDKDSAAKLAEYQKNMMDTLNELKRSNDLNSKLIQNSIDYINFSINLYTDNSANGNNYANTGQLNDGVKRNLLDVKL